MKRSLLNARKLHLDFDEHFASFRSRSKTPILFNLDLHISVMRDIQQELKSKRVKSIRWSISGSNRFSRTIYKISDPVDVVNSQTWFGLDEELISAFEDRYRKFLSKFDGFVVTHTPAFSQLYRNFDKPILVINSTRYEAPYTNNLNQWKNLDRFLINKVEKNRMLLVSNNVGDSDYLKYKTGIVSRVVPSLCDYTNLNWIPGGTQKVIVSRSPELEDFIERETGGEWRGIRKVMGDNYSWEQYFSVKEILYIPYNISTMSLFELATAGVPVSVPSREFIKEISSQFPGVLSELSYFQVRSLPVGQLSKDDPNNYLSESFQDWWLQRADFYDSFLMPNVRVIPNFEALQLNISDTWHNFSVFKANLSKRNKRVSEQRSALISNFTTML